MEEPPGVLVDVTVGYHAPEVVRAELSPASDLYTVGRTLAVLALGIEYFFRNGIASAMGSATSASPAPTRPHRAPRCRPQP